MASMTLLGNEHPSLVTTVVGDDGGSLHGLGRDFDAFACGREFFHAEVCETVDQDDPDEAAFGYKFLPFPLAARQKFPVRCEPGTGAQELIRAFDDANEHHFGDVLWNGSTGWQVASGDTPPPYLASSEVETVAVTGDDPRRHIAEVLADACEAHPDLHPVLHLGMFVAMKVGTDGLGALGVPYVVNSAYPIDGIAVTGPVRCFVGSVQDLTHVDWPRNRRYAEGTRLGLIEFDPCLARTGVTGS